MAQLESCSLRAIRRPSDRFVVRQTRFRRPPFSEWKASTAE
jgi:hypothetical protein